MKTDSPDEVSKTVYRDDLGIVTCVHTPQMPRSSFPDVVSPDVQGAPVTPQGGCVTSSAVLPLDSVMERSWNALVAAATDSDTEKKVLKHHFDALMETIAEGGHEMLPLIRNLREKAVGDPQLSEIMDMLQGRLGPMEIEVVHLAPREREVIELAAGGKSNAEIASCLDLQVITVGKALTRAYRKLGAKNRSEAVHKWMLQRDLTG